MRTNLKQRKEGFTIIEVMIVLAIAGLIMLIVFLAVPALQRNSRNTQRKNDVANYAAAVNEYMQNNNGSLPPGATYGPINDLAKDGFLTEPTGTNAIAVAPESGVETNNTAVDGPVVVVSQAKCNGANAERGGKRSFVVLYSVENSSGDPVRQCQEG